MGFAKQTLSVVVSFLMLMQSVIMTPSVFAELIKNVNTGELTVNFFNNPLGIQSMDPTLQHDSLAGTVALVSSQSGSMTMSPINIPSLKSWNEMSITLEIGSEDDIIVDILSCDDVILVDEVSLVGGNIDLSIIDPSETCIKPVITLLPPSNGGPSVVVSTIFVDWEPLAYIKTIVQGPSTILSCETKKYDLAYAVSYVDDVDLYIWMTIDSTNDIPQHTIKPTLGYTDSGQTTSNTLTKTLNNGETATIPAHSLWRHFDTIKAGEASLLSFNIIAKCGETNGTTYTLTAGSNGVFSDASHSNPLIVTVDSHPEILLTKTGKKTITRDKDSGWYFSGYSSSVTYNITASTPQANKYKGIEDIQSYTVVDDVSDIMSVCPITAIQNISDAGVLSGNEIVWNGGYLAYNGSRSVSFDVDYAQCATLSHLQSIENTASIDVLSPSGQSASAQDTYSIVALTDVEPNMILKKTGPQEASYTSPSAYSISLNNPGLVALGDIIITDRIPDNLILDGPISVSNNGSDPQVRYHISTGSTVPLYDTSMVGGGVLGTGWTQTYSEDSRRVAVTSACLGSTWFQDNGALCNDTEPSLNITVPVRYNTENIIDRCSNEQIINTAVASFGAYAEGVTNNVLISNNTYSSIESSWTNSWKKSLPDPVITIDGNTYITPGAGEIFTLTLNNAADTLLEDASIVIPYPTMMINGQTKKLSMQILPGSGADVVIGTGSMTVNMGDMPPNASMQLQVKVTIPWGVENNSGMKLIAQAEGNDTQCGQVSDTTSFVATVSGTPKVRTTITRDLALIPQGGSIGYTASVANVGNVSLPSTYMVFIVPEDTELDTIRTTGMDILGNEMTCDGCQVYTAPASAEGSLPNTLNPSQPFVVSDISSFFSLAQDNNDGTWTPATTNAKYIAIAMDDERSLLTVGGIEKIGIQTTDTGNAIGDQIWMNAAVISTSLPQTIANEVFTAILDYPGVKLSLQTEKDIVEACEANTIAIPYYADVGSDNDDVIITVSIPDELTINTISNTWNNIVVQSGYTSNPVLLSGGDYTLIQTGGMNVYTIDIVQLLGDSLGALAGGTINVGVDTPCDATSNTVYTPTAQVYFANDYGQGQSSQSDDIYVQNADLLIIKNVNRYDPIPGDILTYTLDISNPGLHDASNVSIQDTLPTGTCYVDGSTAVLSDGWSLAEPTIISNTPDCTETTQQILVWNLSGSNALTNTITNEIAYLSAQSETVQVSYQVLVTEGMQSGTNIVNDASVGTTNPEDDNNPNQDSSQTTIPYPNLVVSTSGDTTVNPGEGVNYTLQYHNASRTCAENAYLVHLLPDVVPTPDGQTDIKVTHITTNAGSIYYHHTLDLTDYSAIGTGDYPAFDPTNPGADGWSIYTGSLSQPVNAIAVLYDTGVGTGSTTLCQDDGVQRVTIYAEAKDPISDDNIPIGYDMPTATLVADTNGENDRSDNTTSLTITTPGINLTATIEGDPQGSFPGTIPGAEQSYTITLANTGTDPVCAIKTSLKLSDAMLATLPATITTAITDSYGSPLSVVDPNGIPSGQDLLIAIDPSTSGYLMTLGGGSTATTCLPAHSQATVTLSFVVDEDAIDDTEHQATVHIREESDSNEIYLDDNMDTTSVRVYRADVIISKEGYSDLVRGFVGNQQQTARGETITYQLNYDNIGNATADDTIITDTLPEGVCLDVDDLTAHLPAGATATYYDGDYQPVTSPTTPIDCTIRRFAISLGALTVPATADGETVGQFDGLLSDLVDHDGLQIGAGGSAVQDGSFDTGVPFPGFNNAVYTTTLQPDGKIIVGGAFTSYDSSPANHLIRLNPDGSRDTTFNIGRGFLGNDTVYTTTLQPDGKIIVGGNINGYDGSPVSHIIRLNPDGSRDTTFNIGGGFNSTVYTTTLQPDGKIIVGGAFTSYDGSSALRLIRLNADGSRDTTFNIGAGFNGNDTVYTTTLQPDGKIIVDDIMNLIRLNADGSTDTTFNMSGRFDDLIYTTTLQPDGKIIVGGAFTSYDGSSALRLIRLNADGSRYIFDSREGFKYNDTVNTTTLQPDGKIIVGGYFTSYDGSSALRLIRLNPDGSRDTTFNIGGGFNSAVNTTTLQPDGKIIVGGGFTSYDGSPANRIIRLNPDGSRDTAFNIGGGFTSRVYTTSLQPDGKIIVGGDFTSYDGSSAPSLIRLNPDGSRDTAFNIGGGFTSRVYTTTPQPDGKIIVGGRFTSYDGSSANNLIRLNPDGSRDTTFNIGGGFSNSVNTTSPQPDGKIIVGGGFTSYDGSSAPYLIRLNPDGSRDTAFNIGGGFNGVVNTTSPQPDGKIIVGGYFTSYDGSLAYHLIRLGSTVLIGSYDTVATSTTGFLGRDALMTDVEMGVDSDITVTIAADAAMSTILLGPLSLTDGRIDLSSISPSYETLYLHFDFSRVDAQTASPLMRTWRASYDSTLAPSLSYTVQVTDDVALLSSLDALTNAASISTATPETIISNNYTQKIHYLTKTDLHIQKEVSQTAVQPGDEITYTITYENTGPHDATNVTIADVLPQNITVTSITTGTLAGGSTTFSKTAYGTEQDCITSNVCLTSGDDGLLYNAATEAGFDWGGYTSPVDTERYTAGACGPTPASHTYGSWVGALSDFLANIGNPMCLHLISDDLYIDITFDYLQSTYFGGAPGGAFSYTRSGGSSTITMDIPILLAYHTGSILVYATVNPGVNPGDLVSNIVTIAGDTLESDYTNNYDKATSIVGDFANAYTTIDCPPVGELGGAVSCALTIGNNGNTAFTDGTLEIWMPQYMVLEQTTIAGLDVTCTTSDVTLPHKLICTGPDLTQVDPDQLLTGVVTFVIEEDYSIIAHQTNNLQATPLVVSSHIKTPSPEVTTTDNHAYDTITPVLKDHSSIAGRTYIDVDGSQSYTSFDQVMRDTRVCISGIDVMGGIIDQCQDTNNEGEYVISGLLPGTYELLWIPTSLTGSYSSAGTLYHLVSDGSNPVRVGEGSLQNDQIAVTTIANIVMGRGEHIIDADFAAKYTLCPSPIQRNITSNVVETTASSTTIEGIVSSPNTTLTVNGISYAITAGQFTIPVELVQGNNTFAFTFANRHPSCTQEYTVYIARTGGSTTTPTNPSTTPTVYHYAPPQGIGCRYSDEPYQNNGHFTDTIYANGEKIWGYQYIEQMRLNCIHRGRGTSEGKWIYEPDSSITRAEVMKTMVKIMGIAYQDFDIKTEDTIFDGEIVFHDIDREHRSSWYTPYAFHKGILAKLYAIDVSGDRYFSPDLAITRGEAIQMMIATYEKIYGTVSVPSDYVIPMEDVSSADLYYDAIQKAVYLGIIEGRTRNGKKYIDSTSTITRQEFAKIAYLPFQERFVIDIGQEVVAVSATQYQ